MYRSVFLDERAEGAQLRQEKLYDRHFDYFLFISLFGLQKSQLLVLLGFLSKVVPRSLLCAVERSCLVLSRVVVNDQHTCSQQVAETMADADQSSPQIFTQQKYKQSVSEFAYKR